MLIEIDKQSLFEIYIRRFNDKRIAGCRRIAPRYRLTVADEAQNIQLHVHKQ